MYSRYIIGARFFRLQMPRSPCSTASNLDRRASSGIKLQARRYGPVAGGLYRGRTPEKPEATPAQGEYWLYRVTHVGCIQETAQTLGPFRQPEIVPCSEGPTGSPPGFSP